MQEPSMPVGQRAGLAVPIRNHYFYGQLLGVQSLELETAYTIRQRRLLNRLVLGYGVVCGLDVQLTPDGDEIVITPGLAIDRHGREIIVARRTDPIRIPHETMGAAIERVRDRREDPLVQVAICYHECLGDPVPVLAGDCLSTDPCTPSTIREQYRIEFRHERHHRRPEWTCHVPNLLDDGRVDHDELAKWVTRERDCTRLPGDPCIALANLRVLETGAGAHCDPGTVDIGVRPVLASNVVLMELITALLERRQGSYQ
jgi:hypothetical protein